jgi:hypothetical protein
MRAQAAAFAAGVMAAGLAGCVSDGVMVNRTPISAGFTGDLYVQTSAQNGTNAVVVRNSPVPPEAVVEALRQRYQSGQYRFALGPNPPGWNGYTVVLSFGGPVIGNETLCQNPNAPQAPVSAGTAVVGDYCYSNRTVTEATGQSRAITGPQDPLLSALVGDVAAELFTNEQQPPHGGGGSVTTP